MSYKKNIIPYALAVILHIVLIFVLVWNFTFEEKESPKQFVDAPVQAKLVTAPETPKKDATSLKRKQEQQKKREEELKKKEDEAKRQQELERQKQLEKEKQQELEQEKQRQADAEKKRLEVERQKKLEAEAEKKRKAEDAEKKRQAEIERKKKEAEKKRLAEEKRKKAEAERKKREEAERKKRLEEERKRKELEALEASLDDELFEADKGEVRRTQVLSEVEKYRSAIGAKVRRYWYIPERDGRCVVSFTIGPGGIVLEISDDGGDVEYCESGTTAIKKAVPLPVSDDPEVMNILKDAVIKFDPSFKQ